MRQTQLPQPTRVRRALVRTAAVMIAGAVALPAATAPATATTSAPTSASRERPGAFEYEKVAYFIQWGVYGRDYHVQDVDTSGAAEHLTTINYAFGNVNEEGLCASADPWADYQRPVTAEQSVDGTADVWGQPLSGNFNQLLQLKEKHPQLKVLISLGGWTLSKHFSDAALTAESREALVTSCLDQFILGNLPGAPAGAGAGVFDGIDLDWEWPGSEGNAGNVIRPQDKENFTALVAEFRRQLDAHGAQTGDRQYLTAFLPAAPSKIEAGFEVAEIFEDFDFATVQGYDLHGTWESTTNHQGQLFSPRGDPDPVGFSIDLAIQTYLDEGAPSRKLVVGVPFYGQGWTGVTGGERGGLYGQASGPAQGVWAAGVEDYQVLAELDSRPYRDPRSAAVWLFDGETFWSFDNPYSIRLKARYVRRNDLGGLMAWSLDGDDADASLVEAMGRGLR